MANVYAVASGNWSNTAIWNTGTLPTSADIVRPNGFAVTIDQNITVDSLRNDASAPAVAGGTFTLTGNYTLNISTNIQCFATSLLTYNGTGTAYITGTNGTAAIISSTTTNTTNTVTHSGTGTLVVDMIMNSIVASEVTRNNIAVTGGGTLTCLKEVNAASANQGSGIGTQIVQVLTTAGATLNLKNIRGGTNSTYGVVVNVRTNINVVGNLYSGGSNGGYALWNTDNASVITIVGDIYGTANNNAGQAVCLLIGAAPTTITGNIYGSNSGTTISYSGTLNITGNVTGGGANSGIGLTAAGTTQVTGTITGGSYNGGAGVNVTGGTFTHIGTAQASANGSAITCNAPTTAVVICTGPFLRNGYTVAVASQTLRINAAYNPYFEFRKSDGTNVTYVDQANSNFPAVGNVRLGTSYASGLYTGTLNVPTASQVLAGIPIDNTTGTLLMTPADFWNYLIASGFTTGSIGERLQNSSTVATTGAQIAAYNI
jgi:hypothetical protein